MGKIINLNNFNKTIRYLKKNGFSEAYYTAKERIALKKSSLYIFAPVSEEECKGQREIINNDFLLKNYGNDAKWPLITVVIPAYETKKEYLSVAIESVLDQTYPFWELIIADASSSGIVQETVSEYIGKATENVEEKIRYIHLETNLGISGNTNIGIDMAKGDYIALLDHDDFLTKDALFCMVSHILERVKAGFELPTIVYSDEDKTDESGTTFFEPNLKFDFNYDMFLTNNYICHLMLINREKLGNIRLRGEFDGAQDFDLCLQIIAGLLVDNNISPTMLKEHITHVKRVLYHWRCHSESTAANTDSKLYAYEAGKNAVEKFIKNVYLPQSEIEVSHSRHLGFYNTSWGKNLRDLFEIRPEIGAVISRKLDNKGCMTTVILNEECEWQYVGLHKRYSGELNRFSIAQNVYAADIRYLKMRDEVKALYLEFLKTRGINESQIMSTIQSGTELKSIILNNGKVLYIKDLSIEFANVMREKGYMILYIP